MLRAASYRVGYDCASNSIVFLDLEMLPIYFCIYICKFYKCQNKKTHKEKYIFEWKNKTINGRDRTDIKFSLLALNTVLNSTIPFIIVTCWDREKTFYHL